MLFLSCVVLLMCSGGDLEAAAVVGCVPAGGRTGGHRRGGRRRKTGDLQGTSSENECVQREGRAVCVLLCIVANTHITSTINVE